MAMTTTMKRSPVATPPRRRTSQFPAGSVPSVRTAAANNQPIHMITPIAEITGNIASAFGLLGAALGVGLIGLKAAEAVGRNPGASGKVLVQAIIGMALAEGLGILALFLAK